MDKNILLKAKNNYDFYETESHHADYIYRYHTPIEKLKVIDICCGLGSLVNPWYNNGHEITIVEINDDFIPLLKSKYPLANLITEDYLKYNDNEEYDVYLCNPPFNDSNGKQIYQSFFCKILKNMKYNSALYFIAPKAFYLDQPLINLEIPEDNINYIENFQINPPIFFMNRYNYIDLHSNRFRFNKPMIKRMIENNIIDDTFLKEYDKNEFIIESYFEFRYLRDIFDFKTTSIKCGLFLVRA